MSKKNISRPGPGTVLMAMSGGVDSSTAACLLKEKGYEVTGASMRLPDYSCRSEDGCCGVSGIEDARTVARRIRIPFYALNCIRDFEENVVDYFTSQYEKGLTPNPCVACNEKMKFGFLLDRARSIGADFIATGHYARVDYDSRSGRHILKKAKDSDRDQSYFLFSLTQKQLSKILFPLGNISKAQVRKFAKAFGLKIHDKPGSQEICFIAGDYRDFLRQKLSAKSFSKGPIVNAEGRVLGEHSGLPFYTIGQRKGIGAHGKPHYVIKLDAKNNLVMIGEERQLYCDELLARGVNWIDREKLEGELKVRAKIRYRHKESPAVVSAFGRGRVKVKFKTPQRAITPGQAVVFYKGDVVCGGGWIT